MEQRYVTLHPCSVESVICQTHPSAESSDGLADRDSRVSMVLLALYNYEIIYGNLPPFHLKRSKVK